MPHVLFSSQRHVDYFLLQEPRAEGPLVGYYAGQAISERVIDCFGQHYRFVGVASRLPNGCYDVDALRPGEWLVEPGLVYVNEPGTRRHH
jgi:hypothetical protein